MLVSHIPVLNCAMWVLCVAVRRTVEEESQLARALNDGGSKATTQLQMRIAQLEQALRHAISELRDKNRCFN